jgi:hypothetical protein
MNDLYEEILKMISEKSLKHQMEMEDQQHVLQQIKFTLEAKHNEIEDGILENSSQ